MLNLSDCDRMNSSLTIKNYSWFQQDKSKVPPVVGQEHQLARTLHPTII